MAGRDADVIIPKDEETLHDMPRRSVVLVLLRIRKSNTKKKEEKGGGGRIERRNRKIQAKYIIYFTI